MRMDGKKGPELIDNSNANLQKSSAPTILQAQCSLQPTRKCNLRCKRHGGKTVLASFNHVLLQRSDILFGSFSCICLPGLYKNKSSRKTFNLFLRLNILRLFMTTFPYFFRYLYILYAHVNISNFQHDSTLKTNRLMLNYQIMMYDFVNSVRHQSF